VLIDFGSCHFQGAERLTRQGLAPVTLAYLSPQAGLFCLRSLHQPDSYYPPSPADDLYALGVTAYRLVMGQYPPPWEARKDEQGLWRVTSPELRPLLERNPRVEPELREVIVRLLSEAPEDRGTAAQVAEALEAGAGGAEHPEPSKPPVRARAWKPWLALAVAGACAVLLWHAKPVLVPPGPSSQAPEAGRVAVGDTSPTQPRTSTAPGTEKKPLAQEPLPEPRPGQLRPDKKGQCPGRQQVPINGGCWLDVSPRVGAQACAESGYVFFKGKCFGPALEPPRKPQPTSSPAQAR
jgi:hypothetical protein